MSILKFVMLGIFSIVAGIASYLVFKKTNWIGLGCLYAIAFGALAICLFILACEQGC